MARGARAPVWSFGLGGGFYAPAARPPIMDDGNDRLRASVTPSEPASALPALPLRLPPRCGTVHGARLCRGGGGGGRPARPAIPDIPPVVPVAVTLTGCRPIASRFPPLPPPPVSSFLTCTPAVLPLSVAEWFPSVRDGGCLEEQVWCAPTYPPGRRPVPTVA